MTISRHTAMNYTLTKNNSNSVEIELKFSMKRFCHSLKEAVFCLYVKRFRTF